MCGMWHRLNLCWAWWPLSKGCKGWFAHEPLTGFPWADRKDRKDENGMEVFGKYSKSNSYSAAGFSAEFTSKLGLKTFPEGLKRWSLCYTCTLLQLRQWMDHPRESEVLTGKNTHPFPQTGQSFGADHFRFVLSAEGERMQWGWNAGGLLSLLVNICLRAKWVTESLGLIS